MAESKGKVVLYVTYGNTYQNPAEVFTQEIFDGIRFDFNYGLRIHFPNGIKSPYILKIYDHARRPQFQGTIEPPKTEEGVVVEYNKKFYIDYYFELYSADGKSLLFSHRMNLKDRTVLIQNNTNALGDNLSWIPYYERFRQKHGCNLVVAIQQQFIDIVEKQYPEIKFITPNLIKTVQPYACYYPGLFFEDDEFAFQPVDFRQAGLHRTMAHILGVDPFPEEPPRFDLSAKRKIKDKYVCIGVQSTAACKLWLNPGGWSTLCKYIKDVLGYRVLCIDKNKSCNFYFMNNSMPEQAEDFTGAFSLQERIDLIKDSEFFVGLGSGLSWLSWGCKVPVVMICGFSHPYTEFLNPYRVTTKFACNSCWNDRRYIFDRNDAFTCPMQKEMVKKFECTRTIYPSDVIEKIITIPSVAKLLEDPEIKKKHDKFLLEN